MSESINEAVEAVKEIRSTLESVDVRFKSYDEKMEALNGADKEKVEKLNAVLDKHEAKSQEIFLEQKRLENEKTILTERVESLESKLIHQSKASPVELKGSNEYKAFECLVKNHLNYEQAMRDKNVSDEVKAYLRTDNGQQGGYLAPEILSDQIQKEIIEKSPTLSLVRMRNMRGVKTVSVPVRTGGPTSFWVGENETITDSNSEYRLTTLTAKALGIRTRTTRDLLNFAGFDMKSEIQSDATDEFGREIGKVILVGNGKDNPQGILDTLSGVENIDTAGSGAVSFDDVINLTAKLKNGYSGVLGFNQRTRAVLRTEKDSSGNYLWRVGGEGMPNLIVDVPYILMPDMPDIGIGAQPVIFGDFFKGYTVLDSMEMEMIRNDFTDDAKRAVFFTWFRFLDGKVTIPEAFKLLNVKA